MSLVILESLPKPRLKALLDHLGTVPDPRNPWQVAFPLQELLLLVVCGTICDCDDYDVIAEWGERHLDFLRRFLPYHRGVPGGRWLTILMNRIGPGLFSAAFTDWVRATWPDRPDLIAIDGKTSRRSHDRAEGKPPLHLVSAFATTARLVLGQEAVPDKASETTAIPVLLERLGQDGSLEGALVSIDAVATNPVIADAILAQGADYLLAVKANQPSLRSEVESAFLTSEGLDTLTDHDKGHGRIEARTITVLTETDWLTGPRRFPGETRLPGARTLIRVVSRTELRDRSRFDTRYFVASRALSPAQAAQAVRGHWAIENSLHWTLDVTFRDDQSRVRKGHGAKNMAIVRHFAINLVRKAPDQPRTRSSPFARKPKPGTPPKPTSLKLRRKLAGWDPNYLQAVLGATKR